MISLNITFWNNNNNIVLLIIWFDNINYIRDDRNNSASWVDKKNGIENCFACS